MRAGINRETGRLLTGWDHCVQSIAVVLTTRLGSRVMRRAFGSRIHELQDQNPDPATLLKLYVAVAEALRRWEPGFRLERVSLRRAGPDGVAVFDLAGIYYPRGHLGVYTAGEQRSASLGRTSDAFQQVST